MMTLTRFADRFAAAAAVQDPGPLLRLQATQVPEPPRRRGLRLPLRPGTDGAVLLMAAVALALLWANSPWARATTPSGTPAWR